MIATVKAAGLDPNCPQCGHWNDTGQAKTARYTIRFAGGRLILFNALDGRPDDEGWHGTYTVADDDTIVARDDESTAVITYQFAILGDRLKMRVGSDTDPSDLVPQTGIYSTAPFIRQP